jgi:hypothetical protein
LAEATHVDVVDGRAGAFRNARASGHPARFAAGKLDEVQSITVAFDPPPRLALACGEGRAVRHFRDDEPRAPRRTGLAARAGRWK